MNRAQKGFSIIEVAIVVVILGIIGFLAYSTYMHQQTAKVTSTQQSHTATDVPTAPAVNSSSDLTTAQQTVDNLNVDDGSDSSQLNSQLNAF